MVQEFGILGYTDTCCPNGQTQTTTTNAKLLLRLARPKQPLLKTNIFRCSKVQCLIATWPTTSNTLQVFQEEKSQLDKRNTKRLQNIIWWHSLNMTQSWFMMEFSSIQASELNVTDLHFRSYVSVDFSKFMTCQNQLHFSLFFLSQQCFSTV